jgi:hypothetical protein
MAAANKSRLNQAEPPMSVCPEDFDDGARIDMGSQTIFMRIAAQGRKIYSYNLILAPAALGVIR